MRHLREKVIKVTLGIALACWSSALAQSAPRWTAEPAVLSAAASTGGSTIVLGAERQVYGLNADGKVQWQAALGDIGRAFPVVRPDGSLLVASYDDRLYALSSVGQLLWNTKLDGDIFASPALLPDGSAVVATAGGSLYRIGTDGEVLWRQKLGSPSYSSPAVSRDGQIYLGSQAGTVFAFNLAGEPLWTFQAGRSVFSSPALDAEGNLYFGSANRSLYSLDPAGQQRWRQELSGFVNASPLVTASGQVVVGSFGGELNAYSLDGTLAWSYPAGAAITAAATELWNGDLLVGDLGGVLHRVSQNGVDVGRQDLGDRIDTPVSVTDDGTWLVVADSRLQAYAGGLPQAPGPWSSFRGTPQGWGRQLSEAEQAAVVAVREQVAGPLPIELAQTPAAGVAQPVAAAEPEPSEPVVAVEPAPTEALVQPGAEPAPVSVPTPAPTAAPVAVEGPRLIGGRVHLPLTALAAAYGLSFTVLPVQEGQKQQAEVRQGEQVWTLPVVTVADTVYASIGDLGRQKEVKVGTSAQGLHLEWAGQSRDWPLDWVQLYANPLPKP